MRKTCFIFISMSLISLLFSCSSSQTNLTREVAEVRYYEAIRCNIEKRDDFYCIVNIPHLFANEIAAYRIDSHDGGVDFDKEDISKESKLTSDGIEILFDGKNFKGRGIKSSASKYRGNKGEAVLFDFANGTSKITQTKMFCEPAKFDSRFFKGAGVSTLCN